MHHYLSLFTLEFDAGAKYSAPYPSVNEDTQRGIFDLAQTASGEIIIAKGGTRKVQTVKRFPL